VAVEGPQIDRAVCPARIVGSGFLEANPDLATQLKSGDLNLTEWFNEPLRLVYRLIFVMVAEDRSLLHPEKASPTSTKSMERAIASSPSVPSASAALRGTNMPHWPFMRAKSRL
jgi:hypothetical protein